MDNMTLGNVVDIIAVALVAISGVRGFFRGLSGELAQLAGTVGALLFGLLAYDPTTTWLMTYTVLGDDPRMARAVAFVGTILAASVAMVLLRYIVRRVVRVVVEGSADRWLGLAAGSVRTTLIVVILFLALNMIPHPYLNRVFGEESRIGRRVASLLPRLEARVPEVEQIRHKLEDATKSAATEDEWQE